MILTYSLRRDWDWEISGGDADWLGTDAGNPAYLSDRRPATRTHWTWPSGSQTTATVVHFSSLSPTFTRVRGGAFLATSLPLGTKITIAGKRSGDPNYDYNLGGNSQSSRVALHPDGTRGVVWYFDAGLDPCIPRITVWNDVYGIASIAAESEQSMGEVIVAPGVFVEHDVGPSETGPTLPIFLTLEAQASVGSQLKARTITVRSTVLTSAEARGDALEGGTSWQRMQHVLGRDPFTLMILYPESHDLAQTSAIFGTVSGMGIGGLAGRYQQSDRLTFTEVPGG